MKIRMASKYEIISSRYHRRDIYVITYLPTGNQEFQNDYDKFGGDRKSFKVEVIDYQFAYFSDRYDPEHSAMIKLKTYDERYGYNTHDHGVQWIREKYGLPVILSGWQKRKAIAT